MKLCKNWRTLAWATCTGLAVACLTLTTGCGQLEDMVGVAKLAAAQTAQEAIQETVTDAVDGLVGSIAE